MPWVPKLSRSTKKTYWYNTTTKETTWKKPPIENHEKKVLPVKTPPPETKTYEPTSPPYAPRDPCMKPHFECLLENPAAASLEDELKHIVANVLEENEWATNILHLKCGGGRLLPTILALPHVKVYRGVDENDSVVGQAIGACNDFVKSRQGYYSNHYVGFVTCDMKDEKTVYACDNPVGGLYRITLCSEFPLFCKTKKLATSILTKINNALEKGGLFVAFLCDAAKLTNSVRNGINNAGVSIKPHRLWKGNGRFGDPYLISLKGWTKEHTEYIVPEKHLLTMAAKSGFEHVKSVPSNRGANFFSTIVFRKK